MVEAFPHARTWTCKDQCIWRNVSGGSSSWVALSGSKEECLHVCRTINAERYKDGTVAQDWRYCLQEDCLFRRTCWTNFIRPRKLKHGPKTPTKQHQAPKAWCYDLKQAPFLSLSTTTFHGYFGSSDEHAEAEIDCENSHSRRNNDLLRPYPTAQLFLATRLPCFFFW